MDHARTRLIPEIQGLRAIAVLAVLIYHIWPNLLTGGYVGVDVFFVISGYLITGSLFREFEATGRISLTGFYARRIRRLVPAATLVCLAVSLALPLFPYSQRGDIASSVVASALYVQNWLLAAQAVDYLAGESRGPMIHFWSLSVEEQYYILWPLLILPLLSFAKRLSLSLYAVFGWLSGGIVAGSLAYSIYLTRQDAGVAYFATTTRIWELALGGALAVFQNRLVLSERLRNVFSLFGLGAIAFACWAYSDATPFPGSAALAPTLGAAAVILSSGSQSYGPMHRLLRLRPFQYLGDVSYSLYLWHWPIIVIYSQVTGYSPGARGGIALFLLSCALAHISKVLVEDYFRNSRFSLRQTFAAGATCLVVTSLVGWGYLARERGGTAGLVGEALRGALAMESPAYDWRKEDLATIVPRLEWASEDVPSAYSRNCYQRKQGTEILTCSFGRPGQPFRIVLVGDSHAIHWFPAFEEIAQTHPIHVQGAAKSECLFSLEPIYSRTLKRPFTECAEWSKNVIAWLAKEKPDLVLISQSPAYPRAAVEGMAAAWRSLVDMGLDIRAIQSTPWMPFVPAACLEQKKNPVEACAPLRSDVFKPDLVSRAAGVLKVPIVEVSEYFCREDHCPSMIGGALVYRDRHHISSTFARTFSRIFVERLSLN